MAISVGSALGAGFSLIGRRFFSVIAWGFFLYFAAIILFLIGIAVVGFSVFGDLAKLGPGGAATDPAAEQQLALHLLISIWPALLIVMIGMMIIGAMIQGAVFRSILMPDQRGFFSLRLGGREMALVLLSIVIVPIVLFAYLVSAGILGAVFYGVSRMPQDSAGYGVLLAVLFCIFYALAFMWIALRFSMAAPMTFAEGRVRFFSSWGLTKGHGWTLFGLAWLLLIVFFGVMIAYSIVNAIITGIFSMGAVAAMGQAGANNDPSAIMANLPALLLPLIPSFILGVAFQGVSQAILQGPWAEVYRELRGSPDVATTFS